MINGTSAVLTGLVLREYLLIYCGLLITVSRAEPTLIRSNTIQR